MKTIILLLISLFIFISTLTYSQSEAENEINQFRLELNKHFADTASSPLPEAEKATFRGLDLYPIDLKYRISAELIRTPGEDPFGMATTTERLPVYVKYGEAHFNLHGKDIILNIYQNIKLTESEEYRDYLFLPFNDLTNGEETYGGGRYIDLKIPAGDTIIIDFNQAYNPYCAYNHKYSCPVPPRENRMEVEIRAGVKKPGK
ncbi:MAG: DUF1684 domain-containing protein [Bacteroidetes bacterium]|nr:DUF1684 domain-containing protein [Bacteroidota bacterium]